MNIRRLVFLVLMTAAAAAPLPAQEAPKVETAALVIIDIQDFYFEGGALPLEGSVAASEVAGKVLARFRDLGWPVVHVQHLPKGCDEPGQNVEPPSYRIHSNVVPVKGEVLVGKHFANSFRETDLLEVLRSLEVKKLVIVGMQTHMCLEAGARAAADLGYEVTVVHDACATRDLSFAGKTVSAAEVHASTLASLDGAYARVVGSDQLLEELQ